MLIDYIAIGKRIRQARKKKKWSQELLSEKIGVSAVYISRIENGNTSLSLETLVKLAYHLEVHVGNLLDGSYHPLPNENEQDLSSLLESASPKQVKMILEIIKIVCKGG